MMNELERDPVPQFTSTQIDDATKFLKASISAMQDFVDGFKEPAARIMEDDKLSQQQEKARESIRQLVLLFSDRQSQFNTQDACHGTIVFQERQQSQEVRSKLTCLQQFLKTFADAKWLGKMVANDEFHTKQKLAVDLLGGLLLL